jgi:hypothetical protein
MLWVTVECCWHTVKADIVACAVMCCQVRKLMTLMEDSMQQQQPPPRHQASSSSDRDDSWTSQSRHYMLLMQILGYTSLMTTTEEVQAAWRDLAKPTAAMLEHMMHVQLSPPAGADMPLMESSEDPRVQKALTWQVATCLLWIPRNDCVD